MATAVIMPKQGQSVETCIITQWFKNTGDTISTGDILFSYETDKAAFDLEAPVDGILLAQFYGEGDEVPVLVNVAVIGNEGENTDEFNPNDTSPAAEKAVPEPDHTNIALKAEDAAKVITRQEIYDSKIRISPRAKKLAEAKNLNYLNIIGSGPNGRIIARDIEETISGNQINTAAPGKPGSDFSDKPLSNVRKLIAKAMHASLQNSAQLTHHMSADVRHLLEARKKIKEEVASGASSQDITINDMVCWCVIQALRKSPEANSHYLDNQIRTFNKVHLGLAVDTNRGLMVPAIKNTDDMDLLTLSKELKSAADACRKGNIAPELIQSDSATFTISNLGNYGVEMFTPVINLPQVGILGVCTIINRPADMGNNIFGFVPYIGLSLTYDHRAIDGGPATLFLKEIKKQIENFRQH